MTGEDIVVLLLAIMAWRWLRKHSRHRRRLRVVHGRFATPQQRAILYRRQHGRCAACHQRLVRGDTECDHILPWAFGGRTELKNLRLLHHACHARITRQEFPRWRKVA